MRNHVIVNLALTASTPSTSTQCSPCRTTWRASGWTSSSPNWVRAAAPQRQGADGGQGAGHRPGRGRDALCRSGAPPLGDGLCPGGQQPAGQAGHQGGRARPVGRLLRAQGGEQPPVLRHQTPRCSCTAGGRRGAPLPPPAPPGCRCPAPPARARPAAPAPRPHPSPARPRGKRPEGRALRAQGSCAFIVPSFMVLGARLEDRQNALIPAPLAVEARRRPSIVVRIAVGWWAKSS